MLVTTGDPRTPRVVVTPPVSYMFQPNYCQFFFSDLFGNHERNLGTIAKVRFNKVHEFTVLRITWEGNFRSVNMSWYRLTRVCMWFLKHAPGQPGILKGNGNIRLFSRPTGVHVAGDLLPFNN